MKAILAIDKLILVHAFSSFAPQSALLTFRGWPATAVYNNWQGQAFL